MCFPIKTSDGFPEEFCQTLVFYIDMNNLNVNHYIEVMSIFLDIPVETEGNKITKT